MLETKVIRGYNLYNWYQYLFQAIMFNNRYKYCNHKLLKRYIAYKYIKGLRGK